MAELFRKSSLEKISSPEQLDKAITVSKPASWLALLGITVMIAATVVWSILGSLPTTVSAQGIATRFDGGETVQIVECYLPYTQSIQIKTGMKATVQSLDSDLRIDAEVVEIIFDNSEISDMELALGAEELVVVVKMRVLAGKLPERTIVTAKIITEEVAPINKVFMGIHDRLKG